MYRLLLDSYQVFMEKCVDVQLLGPLLQASIFFFVLQGWSAALEECKLWTFPMESANS